MRVVSITGRIGDDERRAMVEELAAERCRVLVATDCLSEGINLQHAFNAVLHYDLPWNPNRLEQREGRVDRYGQQAERVKAIRYYCPDSAVDGVVLDVLLNKAREIHRTLGTHVPVPDDSETVTEALLNALFLRGSGTAATGATQLKLDFGTPEVESFHLRWDLDVEREKINRTRFAQRALKPAEVRQELEATDAVLGDPDAVREFVLSAAQRLGLSITRDKRPDVFRVAVGAEARLTLPDAIKFVLPTPKGDQWRISFKSPTPEGSEYLGRNHRFVVALARFLMEEALTKGGAARAARCGVVRTRAVTRLTTILLMRVRYLLHQPSEAHKPDARAREEYDRPLAGASGLCGDRPPLLSEEVIVTGLTSNPKGGKLNWLADDEALRLLADAKPDANVPMAEKRQLIESMLSTWRTLESAVQERIKERAAELEKSHKRVRHAVSLKIRQLTLAPQLQPDLLGILVLQPLVNEGR